MEEEGLAWGPLECEEEREGGWREGGRVGGGEGGWKEGGREEEGGSNSELSIVSSTLLTFLLSPPLQESSSCSLSPLSSHYTNPRCAQEPWYSCLSCLGLGLHLAHLLGLYQDDGILRA